MLNVIEALKECKEKGIATVIVVKRWKRAEMCDYCIRVPSNETPRVQEAHILIGHIICAVVEGYFLERILIWKL